MKKKKFGFSLAEVLLALGIISIIVTMGYTATKKNIDNTYDLYYYTAYKGLHDVFQNAKENNITINFSDDNQRETLLDYLAQNLVGGNHVDNTRVITAANGISYTFINSPTANNDHSFIHVTIPAKRNANNNSGNMCLFYNEADNGNFSLIPTRNSFGYLGCPSSIDDIQNRSDILPFYIDDGIVGRNPMSSNRIPNISFNEAFCRVHSSYAKLRVPTSSFDSYSLSTRHPHPTGGSGWNREIVSCEGAGNSSGLLRIGKPKLLR